tara:strand:+ start:707 stop:949 length:243 start_codon:yes stop_codon:yes gene_type:complete
MNRTELEEKAEAISKEVRTRVGDNGSCIMGYKLKLDGSPIVKQPSQGSSTCEAVYSEVKKMLIENGVDSERISIDYGRMD